MWKALQGGLHLGHLQARQRGESRGVWLSWNCVKGSRGQFRLVLEGLQCLKLSEVTSEWKLERRPSLTFAWEACVIKHPAYTENSKVLKFWLQQNCVFSYDNSFPNLAWLSSVLDCSGGHGIVCGIHQNQAYSIWSLRALSAASTSPARAGPQQVRAKWAKIFVVGIIIVIVIYWKEIFWGIKITE